MELIDKMGSDLTVVNAARVSYDKHSTELKPEDEKLIYYLADHYHHSPFYHPQLSFRVTAPIFVARQLMRHHVGLAVNEVSRRYVDTEPEFDWPAEWRRRNPDVKQGSGGGVDFDTQDYAETTAHLLGQYAKNVYKDLLEMGIAPEQARMVLPMSTLTTWIWTGSLYAFFTMYAERTTLETQDETMRVARRIGNLAFGAFPVSWVALENAS